MDILQHLRHASKIHLWKAARTKRKPQGNSPDHNLKSRRKQGPYFPLSMLVLLMLVSCQANRQDQSASRVDKLPYYQEASFTPQWYPLTPPPNFHTIPAFRLNNQDGQEITEETFKGKIYIANFFFTICPGICPKMMANMASVAEAFYEDEEVLFLSHSVTPSMDSVSVLKKYAMGNDIPSEKWHLVTGDREEIYDLGRRSYFAEEDLGLQKDNQEFLHTENLLLIDQNRYIRGIYNGLNNTSVAQLIEDIRLLKQE
ncbi:MAG: SCO family protein [Bacteroidota bacterium]